VIEAASTVGPSAYWYLTRATGIVALVLLTLAVLLGMLNVSRVSTRRWPRFLIDGVHRNVSLLAVAFLVVHIFTSVIDAFAPIGLLDAVIPFHSSYRPFWLGLGALAFDLLVAVVVTSIARSSFGFRAWRVVHWLAYACWPLAVLHGLGTGSDTKQPWLLALVILCVGGLPAACALPGSSARWGLRLAWSSGSQRVPLVATGRAGRAPRTPCSQSPPGADARAP
jgi:sulfoxide reductase heme-binding subunit YedZ